MNRALRAHVRRFQAVASLTLAATYVLIAVGGTVRATGAGMGCPDWPTCFGRWIPPTEESQLPADYREIYGEHGYADVPFNAVKTWTEYVNRLFGVLVGLMMIATFMVSTRVWSYDRGVPLATLGALLMVGFVGWLGSIVVETNLADWSISVHLFGALLSVALLIVALVRTTSAVEIGADLAARSRLGPLFGAVLLLSIAQIVMGTEIRGEVDVLLVDMAGQRADWIPRLGPMLLIHRSFSILVLAANIGLAYRVSRVTLSRGPLPLLSKLLVLLVVASAASGAGLYYLGMPAVLQPIHLLAATLVIGLQIALWRLFRRAEGAFSGGF